MDQYKKDSEQVLLQRKTVASRSTPHAFTASKNDDDDDDVLKKNKGKPATELNLKKDLSSFEMARFLALLTSIPPLEREGDKEGKDGRAAVVASSFGGAVGRWSHSIYWNRREGMFIRRAVLLVLSN
jgi:hypothetical protein